MSSPPQTPYYSQIRPAVIDKSKANRTNQIKLRGPIIILPVHGSLDGRREGIIRGNYSKIRRKWNNIRRELSDSCSLASDIPSPFEAEWGFTNTRVFCRKCEASVYLPLNWVLEALGVKGTIVPIELEQICGFRSGMHVSQLFAVWAVEFSFFSCASVYLVWARTWTAWAFLITAI